MKCDHCGRDLIPVEGLKFCPLCGGALNQADSGPYEAHSEESPAAEASEAEPSGTISPQPDEYCPWEDQENLGFAEAIARTLRQSLFSPQPFFAKLPREGGFLIPLLYALIVETTGTMANYLWSLALGNTFSSVVTFSGNLAVGLAVLIPVLVFIGTVLWALVLHVSLFVIGRAHEDFEATFRVVCYSSGPELFNAIPLVGGLVGLVWKIYITVVGVREVHRITTAGSIVALALPLIACCGILVGGIALVALLTAIR